MFGSRESERKKERKKIEKRKNKSKTKTKTIYLQKQEKKLTKILQRLKFTTDPPHLLQNMRGIYRPPQSMKLPKTLITKLSYRIGE